MASYEIGELLLELGFEGEQEFERSLTALKSKIGEADSAGESFYRNNRKGYAELKDLTERMASFGSSAAQAFYSGSLSANEYAAALDKVAQVQALAKGVNKRLGGIIGDLSGELERAGSAMVPVAKGYENLASGLELLEARYKSGKVSAEEMAQGLSALASEAMAAWGLVDASSDAYAAFGDGLEKIGLLAKSLDLELDLDTEGAEAKLELILEKITALKAEPVNVAVEVDTVEAEAKLASVQDMIEAYEAEQATAVIHADTAPAEAKLADFKDMAREHARFEFSFEFSKAKDALDELIVRFFELQKTAKEVDFDPKQAGVKLAALRKEAEGLGGTLGKTGASAERLKKLLEAVSRTELRFDTSGADNAKAKFEALSGEVESLNQVFGSDGDLGAYWSGMQRAITETEGFKVAAGLAGDELRQFDELLARSAAQLKDSGFSDSKMAALQQELAELGRSFGETSSGSELLGRGLKGAGAEAETVKSALSGVADANSRVQSSMPDWRGSGPDLPSVQSYQDRLTTIDSLHRAGVTSTGQFRGELGKLKAEVMQTANTLEKGSWQYLQYIQVAGRAGAATERLNQSQLKSSYFSRQFILGNALSYVYGTIGIAAMRMATNSVKSLGEMALASERAADTNRDLAVSAREAGESFASVEADVEELSNKYFMLADDASQAAGVLLEAGYSSEQVRNLLDAVGASAVKNGKDVRESFAEVANSGSDYEGTLTRLSGSTEIFKDKLFAAAAGNYQMVEALGKSETNAAAYAAVMEASAGAMESYADRTDGVVGAQLRAGQAVEKFQRELGTAVTPTVERATIAWANFVNGATASIGPVMLVADAMAQFAGRFSAGEAALIGMIIAGPKFLTVLGGMGALLPKIATSMAGLVALFGGWPVVIGVAAAGAFAYFNDSDTAAQKLEKSLKSLSDEAVSTAGGLLQLEGATDDDGMRGAIEALAATMDGEAKDAFIAFAEEAIATSETTVEALEKIYDYIGERGKEAISGALAAVERTLAPLEAEEQLALDFGATERGQELAELLRRIAEVDARRRALGEEIGPGISGERMREVQAEIQALSHELQTLLDQRAALNRDSDLPAIGAVANQASRAEEMNELYEKQAELKRELAALERNPRESLLARAGLRPERERGGTSPRGADSDVVQEYRDAMGVARAELAALRAEHERLGSVDSYVALVGGTQAYIASIEEAIAQYGRMGTLSAAQTTEQINLSSELAAEMSKLNTMDFAENERNTATMVENLVRNVTDGTTVAALGFSELGAEKKRLEAELANFSGIEVLSPQQLAAFTSLQAELGTVETALGELQGVLDEDRGSALFEGAKRSARDLIREQQLIPKNLLDTLSGGGADVSIYEGYNAGLQETLAKTQTLLDIHQQLERSGDEMARAQRLAGDVVDENVNRAQALREAIAAAWDVGTPEAMLDASLWEAQLSALDGMMEREENLAAGAAEIATQVGLVTDAWHEADKAAAGANADETGVARQQAQLESLKESLVGLEETYGKNSVAANALRAEMEGMDDALARNASSAETLEGRMGDGVAYTAQLAVQTYGSYSEALTELGKTTTITVPLLEALQKAFGYDPAAQEAVVARLRETEKAILAVQFALSQRVPPPQWARDLLAGEGLVGTMPDGGFGESSAALERSGKLLSDYNKGLVDMRQFSSEGRSAAAALRAEMAQQDTGTMAGVSSYKTLVAALEELEEVIERVSGEQIEVEFKIGLLADEGMTGDAFVAFARERVDELRAKMAELDTTTTEGRQAWLNYMATINQLEGAMSEATTVAAAMENGFANIAGVLRSAGNEGGAAYFDVLSGAAAGFDKILKGGSIEDGIKAIGSAFMQSEDEALRSIGNMISGAVDLGKGIATGDPTAIIGGALQLLMGIIDHFTAGAKRLAEAEREVREYRESFNIVDGTAAKSVRARTGEEQNTAYQRGREEIMSGRPIRIIWPWEDEGLRRDASMPIEIESDSLVAAFAAAESGLSSAFGNAMKSFIQTGSLGDFEAAWKEAVLNGFIEGFLASKAFQELVGEPLSNYYEVALDPNSTKAQIDAAFAPVEVGMDRAADLMIDTGKRVMGDFGEGGKAAGENFSSGVRDGIKGAFSSSLDAAVKADLDLDPNTTAADAFRREFSEKLKEDIKVKLIEAFMETEAMTAFFDRASQLLDDAMADGFIDPGEMALINAELDKATDLAMELVDSLRGLEDPMQVRVDTAIAQGSLKDLYALLAGLSEEQLYVDRKRVLAQKALNTAKIIELAGSKEILKTELARIEAAVVLGTATQANVDSLLERIGAVQEEIDRLIEANRLLYEEFERIGELTPEQRRDLEVEIKARVNIDEESLRGSLSGAFNASTYDEFVDGFGTSIQDTVRNAIVQAFLESAAMSSVLKKLSDAIFEALKDGEIDAGELAGIQELAKEAEKLGGELFKLLESLGLTTKKAKGGGGGGPDWSSKSLSELWAARDKAAAKGNKDRLEKIELEIKGRLKITKEDLTEQLRSAFDSATFSDFNKSWGESLEETTRNALIQAFLEGSVMAPLLAQLSDLMLGAMKDGKISPEEKRAINEKKSEISAEAKVFFQLLKDMGFGFKQAKPPPDYSKMSLGKLYSKGPKNKGAVEEIKARLKIDIESLRSQLRDAFDSSSFGEFQKKFGESLHDTTRNALITAFMEGAVMAPLLTGLSNAIMMAMKDGVVSAQEKAEIRAKEGEVLAAAEPFFRMLQELGYGFKKPKKEYDPSKDSIERLYQRSRRGNKKATEEIDVRLKIDVGTVRSALESAFDSANLKAFHKNFGEAMRDITRQAMIAAFLESAVMQALFTTFSATIRAALADGVIDAGEMAKIKADQKAIADQAAPFFQLLKSLGLGFKGGGGGGPNYGEMSIEELWKRHSKAKGKKKIEIEAEIKGRYEVDKDKIAGDFRAALDNVSFKGFSKDWGKSLRETTRNALIQAFMQTARMQGLFDRLGSVMAKAVKDQKVTGWGRKEIKAISKEIEAEGKVLMQLLQSVGLGFKEEPDYSKMDLDKLWKRWQKNPKNKEVVAEIKARLSIDVDAFKSAVSSAFDTDTLKDFSKSLEINVKQSVRTGLIAAFMESKAMKPLLDKLSNDAMEALRDGKVTDKELAGLMKTSDLINAVGGDFYKLLDQLGLGFLQLKDKVSEVSESLTNVPSGFKVAYTRFMVSDPVKRERNFSPTSDPLGGKGSVAEQFKGATLVFNVKEGVNVDLLIDEMKRRGAIASGGKFGSPAARR